MKLSELIPLMQQCIEEHGDLPVVYEDYGSLYPATQLAVEQATPYDAIEDGTLVALFV